MNAKQFGKYQVVGAGYGLGRGPQVWRVYYLQASEPMSEHESRGDAVAAVKRYQAADARRARQAGGK